MWRIKQIFEDVIYTILDDISSRPVMSMHISCASLLSKYNNYYTIEGINNMLQQIKKQFNFHSLLNFARTILWDSLKRRFFSQQTIFSLSEYLNIIYWHTDWKAKVFNLDQPYNMFRQKIDCLFGILWIGLKAVYPKSYVEN